MGLPKASRYSLGQRIDLLFIETMEALSAAGFTSKAEKLPYVRLATRKLDTLKLLLMVLWETKSLDTRKYAALSALVEEVGRMLGGWHGHLVQQNSPSGKQGEK